MKYLLTLIFCFFGAIICKAQFPLPEFADSITWSDNKKEKITSTEQTGIDPKNLEAMPIGDYAGSYKTNRGTAQLAKK